MLRINAMAFTAIHFIVSFLLPACFAGFPSSPPTPPPPTSPPPSPPLSLVAPFAFTAPTVDGVIALNEYRDPGYFMSFTDELNPSRMTASTLTTESSPLTKSLSDLSAWVYFAYTNSALYVAVNVTDQFVATSSWTAYYNDVVEIFIDGDMVANDYVP